MNTRLKVDLSAGLLEVEGEESFVKSIYKDYKTILMQHAKAPPRKHEDERGDNAGGAGSGKGAADTASLAAYSSLGDVFADVENPKDLTNGERALLASAYLQAKGAKESFDSQSVNKELTHAGYKSDNITRDLNVNMALKPATIAQVRKSGTSRQARKEYKVTSEGMKAALRILAGTNGKE